MTSTYDSGSAVARAGPAKSASSLIAIAAAVGSFVLSYNAREGWALLAAFVAIGFGLLGSLKALSPRVSGGILSLMAIGLGVLATVVALIAVVV
jgi:hypothetical protein